MTHVHDGLTADVDTNGWELESAVARQHQFPAFSIPDEQDRIHLEVGARVQLLVLLVEEPAGDDSMIQCERLWVTIDAIDRQTYRGILDSEPVSSSVLRAGDQIRFAPEHIATIRIPRTDPRHPQYGDSPAQ